MLQNYLKASRSVSYNLILALILMCGYEAGQFLDPTVMNGADAWLSGLLVFIPFHAIILAVLLTGFSFFSLYSDRLEGIPFRFPLAMIMIAEAAGWALLIFLTLPRATSWFAPMAWGGLSSITAAFGAGFYEELMFRLVLVGIMTALFIGLKNHSWRTVAALVVAGGMSMMFWLHYGGRPWEAAGMSIVVIAIFLLGSRLGANYPNGIRWYIMASSAILFSAAHYLGTMGDHFQLYSFMFRLLFGLIMIPLMNWRGFAIAAWTHALYDVMVFAIT